jgi:lipopolysaccharide heptosyltransferase II
MTPATALVRLPNHLGDACMALPALRRLEAGGWRLHLAARPWAADLFAGCGWPVLTLPAQRLARIARLREAAHAAASAEPTIRGRAVVGVLLTNSFGTALEFRAAGISTVGYARDGRSLLLSESIAPPHGTAPHMVVYYLALADAWLRRQGGAAARAAGTPPPAALALPLPAAASERARRLLDAAAIGQRYCVLCPVAVGRHRGQIKAWSGFGELCRALIERGETVIGCPGPGETDAVTALLPGAHVLAPVDLATFGALLAASRLVVANDSGPGHLAAAVGAPLLSVFGVTEPEVTQPWGPNVVRVGGSGGWPEQAKVLMTATRMLGRPA